jgi:hypothetical protein
MESKVHPEALATKDMMRAYFDVFTKDYTKAVHDYFAANALFENSFGEEFCRHKAIMGHFSRNTRHGGLVKEPATPLRILIDGSDMAVELARHGREDEYVKPSRI